MLWLKKPAPEVLKAAQQAAEAKQYFGVHRKVVRFRLQRLGCKRKPFYRVVVATNKSRRDGKYIESLGTYDPKPDSTGAKHIELAMDRVKYWIVRGAKPTGRCQRLFETCGLVPPLPRTVCYGPEQAAKIQFEKDRKMKKLWQEQSAKGELKWPTEQVLKQFRLAQVDMQRLEKRWNSMQYFLRANGIEVKPLETH